MSMTVRELIKALRKQDQDALVVWRAHDQSEDECDGYVEFVNKAEPSLCAAEGIEKIVVLGT